jgi:acetoin utilization protein AcuB
MQTTQPRVGRTAQSPARYTIRDFMTALPHTIGRKQSLASAQEKMRMSGLRHLPVLEGGLLAGVLSQRDAYFVETIAGVDPEQVAVDEAMSVDVYSVAPDTPLFDVAAEMADHKYGCAIVTQGTHVVGIFTVVDALRALVAITASSETKTTKP